MEDKRKFPKRRKKYPTEEVEPENFYDNDEVKKLLETVDHYIFNQEDYLKLYNCVHCNECGTSAERVELNRKFLRDGNKVEGLDNMVENFKTYQTPYFTDKMRIKVPEGIPKESKRLFFMGCLSTIKIPRYTEHSLQYFLKSGLDFTIVDKEICCGYPLYVAGEVEVYEQIKQMNYEFFTKGGWEEVLCLCPACYFIFQNDYPNMNMKFAYISDYLKPSEEKKSGKVGFQHLCQLMNRGRPGVEDHVERVFRKSGYEIADIPHWCCGGGVGYMQRTDVIDKVATKRMEDFKKGDYATTYCPGCWFILSRFGKKCRIEPKIKDIFELLM